MRNGSVSLCFRCPELSKHSSEEIGGAEDSDGSLNVSILEASSTRSGAVLLADDDGREVILLRAASKGVEMGLARDLEDGLFLAGVVPAVTDVRLRAGELIEGKGGVNCVGSYAGRG